MRREEDWGRRHLEFPIKKIHKAHYVLMNIECSAEILEELESIFRFNDAVLRHLTLVMKGPVTVKSPMMAAVEKEESAKSERKPARTETADDEDDADSDEEVAETVEEGEE